VIPEETSMSTAQPKHKRILLKLSGEALMGDDPFGIAIQNADALTKTGGGNGGCRRATYAGQAL
jgi:hypothetical protein